MYKDPATGKPLPKASPTLLGYGSCETPRPGEYNVAQVCKQQGHWQYNLINNLAPNWLRRNVKVDVPRTKRMIQLFALHPRVNRMYLEPYLKTRWGVFYGKIGFHGCQSVRHDDHLHVGIW